MTTFTHGPDSEAKKWFGEMLKVAMVADPEKAREVKEEWERRFGALE